MPINSNSHIVHVLLVGPNGHPQQRQPLCVLLTVFSVQSDGFLLNTFIMNSGVLTVPV